MLKERTTILESSKNQDIEQILITSTSETYGTAQTVPINEKHPLVGQSPYSASKISADHLAVSYNKSFNMPIKIVRPFNTYGPRQSARAIIPTIISQALKGHSILKLGSLTPTRDLTYVSDTCNGFYQIYKSKSLIGEVTNVEMNSEISIGSLVGLISEIMNVKLEIEISDDRIRPKNSEVERLICDNKKILENTNWKPNFTLDEGLKKCGRVDGSIQIT